VQATARSSDGITATSGTASTASAGSSSATCTAVRSSSGRTAHPLVVHAHHHVGIAQGKGRRTAGGEREAQAGGSALAGGPRTLVLQPVPLHAVAGGVHDAAAQLPTAASTRLQGRLEWRSVGQQVRPLLTSNDPHPSHMLSPSSAAEQRIKRIPPSIRI